MNIIKKFNSWILIIGLLYTPYNQTQSEKNNFVLEKYIPVLSVGVLSAVYAYILLSPPQEIICHSGYKHIDKSLAEVKKHTKIYYPTINSYNEHCLQKIANTTKYPITSIHEEYLNHSPESIIFFLQEAKKIAPCIVHIEKSKPKKFEFKFNSYFNQYQYNSTEPSSDSLSIFIKEIELLEQNNESVIIIGTAKNNNIESINDINTISFNLENQNPSYKERLEFLQILLSNKNHSCLDIEHIARKTRAFSYMHLGELIQKAEEQATPIKTKIISMANIDTAYQAIIKAYEINIESFKNIYETCIHEMGHAIITTHFTKYFTLHNVSITPQYKSENSFYDQTTFTELGCAQFTKQYHDNQMIEAHTQNIMICLAGKISEQIFFGLSNKKSLNNESGYADFLENPNSAQYDLIKAKNLVESIVDKTKQDKEFLLKDLYAKTLVLLLSYKNKIEICAKLLEQDEFVTASQIKKILEETR